LPHPHAIGTATELTPGGGLATGGSHGTDIDSGFGSYAGGAAAARGAHGDRAVADAKMALCLDGEGDVAPAPVSAALAAATAEESTESTEASRNTLVVPGTPAGAVVARPPTPLTAASTATATGSLAGRTVVSAHTHTSGASGSSGGSGASGGGKTAGSSVGGRSIRSQASVTIGKVRPIPSGPGGLVLSDRLVVSHPTICYTSFLCTIPLH